MRTVWWIVATAVVAALFTFAALALFPTKTCPPLRLTATGRGLEKPWWESIETISQPGKATTFIVPGDIVFATNSATISASGRAQLTSLAPQLANAKTITIAGATDSTGTRPHNLDLAQRRADAARQVLIDAGVILDIATTAWADDHPVADEKGPDPQTAAARNRRIEITINE